jgi:hypothetical protein
MRFTYHMRWVRKYDGNHTKELKLTDEMSIRIDHEKRIEHARTYAVVIARVQLFSPAMSSLASVGSIGPSGRRELAGGLEAKRAAHICVHACERALMSRLVIGECWWLSM